MATAFDATAQFRGFDTLDIEIKRGDKLDIALDGQGIEVVDPLQHLTWRGRPIGRTFEAHIPEKAVADYHPVFRVSKNGALVGRIQFKISVRAGVSQVMTVPTKSSAKRYSHAFISYASEDRREVLKSAQMLKATKIEFFQDILSLDPGVRWEREIYRQIDKSDLFLLFWSNSAKNSEWVIKEALHALELQSRSPDGLPDIVPVILEGPPPVLPPDGLRNLHFDDRIRYFMA